MSDEKNEILTAAANELGIELREKNYKAQLDLLTEAVRQMIHSDFQRLISLLYRMDISERKLRLLLENNPDADAGELITTLIVERQAEKLRTRSQYKQPPPDASEELW
jgi:hypothetical protein